MCTGRHQIPLTEMSSSPYRARPDPTRPDSTRDRRGLDDLLGFPPHVKMGLSSGHCSGRISGAEGIPKAWLHQWNGVQLSLMHAIIQKSNLLKACCICKLCSRDELKLDVMARELGCLVLHYHMTGLKAKRNYA